MKLKDITVWMIQGKELFQSFLDISWNWVHLFLQPVWFIAFFLPALQIGSVAWREYKSFGRAIDSPIPLVIRTWLVGILVGLLGSFLWINSSFSITPIQIALVWGVIILFSLFRFRFACISYSVGLLSILHLSILSNPGIETLVGDHWMINLIKQFTVGDWIFIVGILHMIEWLLIRLDGNRGMLPIKLKHKQGKAVSGYQLSRLWTIALMIPTSSGWIPFPVSLSFASNNSSKPLVQQQRLVSTYILLFAILLLISSKIATFFPTFQWVGALVCLLGHEWIYLRERVGEQRKDPVFVSDEKGLKVLAVLSRTPAEEMGIRSGFIIQKLNGIPIFSVDDLADAMSHAAYCKLEVLDERMDHQILQTAIYEDTPRHLGIIGAVPLPILSSNDEKTGNEPITSSVSS